MKLHPIYDHAYIVSHTRLDGDRVDEQWTTVSLTLGDEATTFHCSGAVAFEPKASRKKPRYWRIVSNASGMTAILHAKNLDLDVEETQVEPIPDVEPAPEGYDTLTVDMITGKNGQ